MNRNDLKGASERGERADGERIHLGFHRTYSGGEIASDPQKPCSRDSLT